MILSMFTIFAHPVFATNAESVYDFTLKDIDGNSVSLSDYRGKVLLIVNTASKCGFTKQYADLVELQKAYKDQGLVVMGFPANNFRNQEPGSNQEIAAFCSRNYGVDFPMFSKVSVKGEDQHALFTYLTSAENSDFTGNIRWNFEKFVVGPDGKLQRRFRSMTNPNGKKVRAAVEEALADSNVQR